MLTIYDLLKKVKTMYGYGKKTKLKKAKPPAARPKAKANKKAKKTKKKM
jgi:hypothetical protein|tara:strand:+ start:1459 stop:1605 length:147 start_codon:yes stop_codon:yes gene_type:complete